MGKRADNSDRGVMLTREAVRRIGAAVQHYEHGDRNQPPIKFRTAADDGGGEDSVRLGTISATWNKGAEATVTQIKGDGSAISPPVTFSAKNWFATVTVSSGTKKVACAKVDGTWLLVAAECE